MYQVKKQKFEEKKLYDNKLEEIEKKTAFHILKVALVLILS